MQSKQLTAFKSALRSLITLVGPFAIEYFASLEKNPSPWLHALALASGVVTKYLVTLFTAKDVRIGA